MGLQLREYLSNFVLTNCLLAGTNDGTENRIIVFKLSPLLKTYFNIGKVEGKQLLEKILRQPLVSLLNRYQDVPSRKRQSW